MKPNLKNFALPHLLISFACLNPQIGFAANENGEQLFLANCAECHQPDGQGIPNIYPALAGNEVVTGSGVDVALVLIIGRGEMPSFDGSLNTADMTAIINYVRNAWGNSGELVAEDTIKNLK